MKRIALLWSAMVIALTVGCSSLADPLRGTMTQTAEDSREIESARAGAETWLQLQRFDDGDSDPSLAILSYPDGPPQLDERTYLYDQALAILWFTWRGDHETARQLTRTLLALQLENGAWGFSFQAREGGFYDADYLRTGAVAWAGWALRYYARQTGDDHVLDAARRARGFIAGTRIDGADAPLRGLYAAGVGYGDPESGERTLGVPVEFVATEHQLDAHMFFRAFDNGPADRLEERILEVLWLDDEGRFAMGATPRQLDRRRALDAAGGWGALWLLSIHRPELAKASLDYTLEHFPADGASVSGGFVPYLDEVDGYQLDDPLIFVEGSLGVGLAALRLGSPEITARTLTMAARLADAGHSGIPYANQSRADFHALPAAASTLWFLMVEREFTTGEQAPVFLPF